MALETRNSTIAGYFEDRSTAERAISALRDAGFTSAHLGVAHKGETATTTTGTGTASGIAAKASQTGEGVWDKVKDFFGAGDSVEPYADEKQSGDLASHEVTPGYGSGSYGASDFGDTMKGMSVDEDRSKYLSHRFGSGDDGVVVTVSAPGREAEAESILEEYGADLGEEAAGYDYSSQPATTSQSGKAIEGTQNVQLLGEALRVHKDRVSRGEVTLRKEVVTEMQTVQVPVTREELVIERHAVNDGTAVSGTIGDNAEIRVPLSEERASIDKNTFVREEVSVGKRSVENVRELSDEVRHEELAVDDNAITNAAKTDTRNR